MNKHGMVGTNVFLRLFHMIPNIFTSSLPSLLKLYKKVNVGTPQNVANSPPLVNALQQ